MKKTVFPLLLIFLPCFLSAQLVHQKRAFSERWVLDGQQRTATEIRLHLDKADRTAAKYYRAGRRADWVGVGFSVVALVGAGWALGATAGQGDAVPGYGLMLAGSAGLLTSSLIRGAKYDRAVETYNLGAGARK